MDFLQDVLSLRRSLNLGDFLRKPLMQNDSLHVLLMNQSNLIEVKRVDQSLTLSTNVQLK